MLKRLLVRYEWLIAMGLLIALFSAMNVIGLAGVNSDLFWMLAGCIVVGEGIIELYYERKADKVTFSQEYSEDTLKTLTQRMNEDPLSGVVTLTHGDKGVTMSFHSFRGVMLETVKEEKEGE